MMMQKQAFKAAVAGKSSQRLQAPVRQVRVRVSTEEAETAAPPKVDFTPNTQAASGYVEFDTAGQSNMYPVVTKAFEVGSNQDTLETGSANLVVGLGAGGIAVAVLALGLVALSQQGAGSDPIEQFKTLSEYAAAFSAEL